MVNSMSFTLISSLGLCEPEQRLLLLRRALHFIEGYYVYSGKMSHVLSGVAAGLPLRDDSQDGGAALL